MEEPAELQRNRHWRTAVWSLRVGYVGLAVGLIGVIITVSGSTPWVLAVGVIIWLVTAVVTVTSLLRARNELPEPRPGLWPMRFMLVQDTVHARSSAQPS
jgi:hypothetical protein